MIYISNNGQLDITETKRLKEKINSIKEEVMEGVAIRARIKEQTEGEQASASLLSKQCSTKSKQYMYEIKTEYTDDNYPNTTLKSQTNISNYVTDYFGKQHEEKNMNKHSQDWFLSFIDKCIYESDNKSLTSIITDEEIYFTLKTFQTNKSPGIDGLPVELYMRFFHIIRRDFCVLGSKVSWNI